MALKTEKRRLGDFLKVEAEAQQSRDLLTVLSGQTLKLGHVCTIDSAGKAKAISATGSETHTYTFTGTPTSGTFTLRLWHKDGYWVTTTNIAYSASQATVDAAIEAVLGSASVVTTVTGGGSAITAIAIAFSGTGYASTVWPLGSVNRESVAGWTAVAITRSTSAGAAQNEVQTITLSGAMTAGVYPLTIFAPDGTPLAIDVAWNTDWATTMAAINTAITAAATAWYGAASAGAVMTGTATAQVLTYSGAGFTGKAVALAQVDTNGITGATSASIARTTAGGTAGDRVGAVAQCICLAETDASGGDVTRVPFLLRRAVVDGDELYWGGCDPTAGATALARIGILVRNEPPISEFS